MAKYKRMYSKRLHLTTKTSLFDQAEERTLEEYKEMDLEWLRKTFKVVKREVSRHPSVEMQGKLSALKILGKQASHPDKGGKTEGKGYRQHSG
jgi:hypothetical protein